MVFFERSFLVFLLLVVVVLVGICVLIVFVLWVNGLMVGNGCYKLIKVVVVFKYYWLDEMLYVDVGKKEELKLMVLIKYVDYIEFIIYKKEYYIKYDDYFYLFLYIVVFLKILVFCDVFKFCGYVFIIVKIIIWDLKKEIMEMICIKK